MESKEYGSKGGPSRDPLGGQGDGGVSQVVVVQVVKSGDPGHVIENVSQPCFWEQIIHT